MDPILSLARERGLAVLEDACQAHGALYRGRPVGTLAGERGLGALSFYPTKNLGALGDGGAVLVNDPALAVRLRQLRNGGQSDRYRHEVAGVNSRLDELQAALLRVGLRHLAAWTERRRALAALYTRALAGAGVELLGEQPYARAVFHLFVVRHARRDALAAALRERGVGTLIHYPIPLHLQPAFADLGGRPGDLPVAEQAAKEILSLPLYPELGDDQARAVVEAVRESVGHV
jgi:dTDP-4-amino-4,6-dideoxygalactose transaminase